jgi:alpha-amylase
MQRRPESYHKKILLGSSEHQDATASIHDRVVFKQEGLNKLLQYDAYPRKSMIDHFWDHDASLDAVAESRSMERGDFVNKPYEAKLRKSDRNIQLVMKRDANAWGIPITINKLVTLTAGSDTLRVQYQLEGLPKDQDLHFASEWNWAGLPAGADDRFYFDYLGCNLGHLGNKLDLHNVQHLGMIDQWLGVSVQMSANRPTSIWSFPVSTVSQSEGGFEMVHQSVCWMPHWMVRGDVDGNWSVTLDFAIAAEHEPKPRTYPSMRVLMGSNR